MANPNSSETTKDRDHIHRLIGYIIAAESNHERARALMQLRDFACSLLDAIRENQTNVDFGKTMEHLAAISGNKLLIMIPEGRRLIVELLPKCMKAYQQGGPDRRREIACLISRVYFYAADLGTARQWARRAASTANQTARWVVSIGKTVQFDPQRAALHADTLLLIHGCRSRIGARALHCLAMASENTYGSSADEAIFYLGAAAAASYADRSVRAKFAQRMRTARESLGTGKLADARSALHLASTLSRGARWCRKCAPQVTDAQLVAARACIVLDDPVAIDWLNAVRQSRKHDSKLSALMRELKRRKDIGARLQEVLKGWMLRHAGEWGKDVGVR